jgi:hypothetical protein
MSNQRLYGRQPAEEGGKLAMTIIPFGKEESVDIMADAVDIGAGGLGIIANCDLEPGYVIMKDNRGEYANGVLLWSRAIDDMTCRAGIQLLSVSRKAG